MVMKPEVIHRRLDRCDLCGRKEHREYLRMALLDNIQLEGENYFPYSGYSSLGWTCDATDAGTISYGPTNNFLYWYDDDNVQHELGTQTWTNAGTFRTNVAVNASGWTHICVAHEVGRYQTSAGALTMTAGLCDSVGGVVTTSGSWDIRGNKRIWYVVTVSDLVGVNLSSLYFYVAATPATDESWWVADSQCEKDVLKPGQFIETVGAAVSRDADTPTTSMVKVCPQCRYRYFRKFRGVIPKETLEPIGVDIPEIP
jgi:hypothetical protein